MWRLKAVLFTFACWVIIIVPSLIMLRWQVKHLGMEVQERPFGKTTLRQTGEYQGMWIEEHRCTMAVVTQSPSIPEVFKRALPFVVVYARRSDGTMPTMPYAMTMQNGELELQIPGDGDREHLILPMSKIIELIEADAARRKQERRIPRAFLDGPQA